MSCDLNKKCRPDVYLRRSLFLLAITLVALTMLALRPAIDPEYVKKWIAIASMTGLVAFAFAVRSVLSARKAIYVGFMAKSIIDADEDISLLLDEKEEVFLANKRAAEFFQGALPLDFFANNLVENENSKIDFDRLKASLKAQIPAFVKLPLKGKMGIDVEWFEISAIPLDEPGLFDTKNNLLKFFNKKETTKILWKVKDVTARHNLDEVLKREQVDLSDFLDFLPVGLFSMDTSGKIHFVNLKLAEWLGFAKENILEQKLKLFLDHSSMPDVDGSWRGEVSFKTKDGSVFDAYVSSAPYDDAGTTMTRVVVIKDMVPEREWENALLVAEKRFQGVFDESPVGIAILDGGSFIEECNKRFTLLTSLEMGDVIGKPLTDIISDEDKGNVSQLISLVMSGAKKSAHIDVSLSTQNDVMASLYMRPLRKGVLESSDNIVGVVLHVIDTTARKNLEAQFAQAQKMQAMGQLAGGVAHDFNNLLTAMIGYSDLLLQRHGPGDPSFSDIMQIRQNSNRAANLVRQLLAFSRSQPLRPRMLDITDSLAELSHLLHRLLGEAITLEFEHGRDLGLVRVDPGQFDQVIINLAVNARDAMPGGGSLKIHTEFETISKATKIAADTMSPGEYVKIEISDTGSGIPKEVISRIFEPFFTTKEGGAGTGLGLSTVYGIIRQTDGFVEVKSKPGKGTDFIIYLPRFASDVDALEEEKQRFGKSGNSILPAQSVEIGGISEKADGQLALSFGSGVPTSIDEEAAPRAMSEREANEKAGVSNLTGTETILMVEDEDAVRSFGARALKNKGYTVLEAASGEDAIEVLEEHPDVDLLITDMVMPGMDGATLAGLVKTQNPKIKVILVSGYSEDIAKKNLADSDDLFFLPKPFSLNELAVKAKEVLES